MRGLVVTNGTLLDKRDIKILIKIKWDRVNFSLDGHSPNIHDSLRGIPGSFEKTVKTINFFSEIKRIKRAHFPLISLSTILTNKNYKNLEEFIHLSKRLGASEVLFQYVRGITNDAVKLKIDDETSFNKYLRKSIKLTKKFRMNTNLKDFLIFKKIKSMSKIKDVLTELTCKTHELLLIPCYYPWYVVMVNEEGKIGPCPVWASRSKINIFSLSLKEAWFSKYFLYLRKKIFSNDTNGCICGAPSISENKNIREEIEKKINILKLKS